MFYDIMYTYVILYTFIYLYCILDIFTCGLAIDYKDYIEIIVCGKPVSL